MSRLKARLLSMSVLATRQMPRCDHKRTQTPNNAGRCGCSDTEPITSVVPIHPAMSAQFPSADAASENRRNCHLQQPGQFPDDETESLTYATPSPQPSLQRRDVFA